MLHNVDVSNLLMNYWPIIVAIAAFGLLIVDLRNTDLEQGRRIEDLEEQMKDTNPVLLDIRVKLASIEATLSILLKRDWNEHESK